MIKVTVGELYNIKKYCNLDEGTEEILEDRITDDDELQFAVLRLRLARKTLEDVLTERLEEQ